MKWIVDSVEYTVDSMRYIADSIECMFVDSMNSMINSMELMFGWVQYFVDSLKYMPFNRICWWFNQMNDSIHEIYNFVSVKFCVSIWHMSLNLFENIQKNISLIQLNKLKIHWTKWLTPFDRVDLMKYIDSIQYIFD